MSPNFKLATESVAQVAESFEKDAKEGKERQGRMLGTAWLKEEEWWEKKDIRSRVTKGYLSKKQPGPAPYSRPRGVQPQPTPTAGL